MTDCSRGEVGDLDIPVDVESVVFGSQNDGAVLHQGNIEALSMLHLALQSTQQLSSLAEHGEVEVVVIVSNADLSRGSQSNTNGEVAHSFSTNLTEVISLVVEHLDTVGPVVADVDLHAVVHNNSIGELEVAGTAELVEDVPEHVKDDHPHDLALHHNDAAVVVSGDSPGMLEYVSSELPDELAVFGEDLDLVSGGPLSDDNVSRLDHHRHSVGVE